MIFQIDKSFSDSISAVQRSELYSNIIFHGHYVDCDEDLRNLYYQDIKNYGSKLQRDMMKKDPSLKLNPQVRKYLTVLKTAFFSLQQLTVLVNKPARLMVENRANASPVYRHIIGTYASADKKFRNAFNKLRQTLKDGELDFENGGGCDAYIRQMEDFNQNEYMGVTKYKFCILTDRDTDDEQTYCYKKDPLFKAVCGKDYTNIKEDDIYTLKKQNYVWHMWYKRAIENYFPDSQYVAINVDMTTMPTTPVDRNYKNLGKMTRYKKHDLQKLTIGMSYAMYENGLKHFYIDNVEMSELQLFLLKLMKII